MEARLWELVGNCGSTYGIGEPVELTVAVDAGVRAAKVIAGSAWHDWSRCLEARGPAYFADAPANLRATLVLTGGF